MAPKKATPKDPTSKVGMPQSVYGGNKASQRGDEWFSDEQNSMDDRRTDQTGGKPYVEAGRGRKLQQQDLDRDQQEGVAGATPPSYKKGGKVHKTGLARLHKGERVIPKSKVHKVEKLMRKASRKRG